MWFKSLVLLFFVGIGSSMVGQSSNDIQISILTCEPGTELYSTYGHSAIRIISPTEDAVFNYGTFDFNQKNFYFNFAQGNLWYRLSKSSFSSFHRAYNRYGRSITEQKLNLNQNQAKKISEFLQQNFLPQNQRYRYDFIYDNCATRVRDVVSKIDGINWNLEKIHDYPQRPIRDWLNDYAVNKVPNMDLTVGFVLGSRTDVIASREVEMFLPDRLKDALKVATNSAGEPLVKETINYTFKPKSLTQRMSYYFIAALILMFSMIGLVKVSTQSKRTLVFDRIFFPHFWNIWTDYLLYKLFFQPLCPVF